MHSVIVIVGCSFVVRDAVADHTHSEYVDGPSTVGMVRHSRANIFVDTVVESLWGGCFLSRHTDLEDTTLGAASHLALHRSGSVSNTQLRASFSFNSLAPGRGCNLFRATCDRDTQPQPGTVSQPSRRQIGFFATLLTMSMAIRRTIPILADAVPAFATGDADGFLDGPEGLKFRDINIGGGRDLLDGDTFKIVYSLKLSGSNDMIDTRDFDLPGSLSNSINLGLDRGRVMTRTPILQPDTIFCVGDCQRQSDGRPQSVIRGLDLSFIGMREGSKRTVLLPPQLAFGSKGLRCRGNNCIIPPDSTLELTIELVRIVFNKRRR